MSLPTNTSFAEEIKTGRLKLLNYTLMAISFCILIFMLSFGSLSSLDRTFFTTLILTSLIMFVSSWFSNYSLGKIPLTVSAWIFILSPMFALGLTMSQLGSDSLMFVPFIFPIVVFIGGLLVSPTSSLTMTILSIAIVIGAPMLHPDVVNVTGTQWFAIFLTILSASLAAIVTGELYQVTQWALDNYSRERRTNEELFEKRQELQKSLKRAEILGEKLMDSNQNLEIANAEAEEAKHFRGQFLANMSHELRTPLNAIIGFSETMLQFPIMYDDQSLPPAYERDLTQIYNSGRQLLHVINDILDLAKVDAGKLEIHMQAIDPMPVINAVMSTAKGLLGTKPVKLQSDLLDPMPEIWADESRLR
ncbi:MAG: HAMP domain-containing sensor histidine kinase, partial [Chloroflexota bacterium]